MPLSERTIILNACDECSTPNEEKLRKCASCGRDIYKEFDLTIEGAVAEMRLKVQQESKLTCSAGIGLGFLGHFCFLLVQGIIHAYSFSPELSP